MKLKWETVRTTTCDHTIEIQKVEKLHKSSMWWHQHKTTVKLGGTVLLFHQKNLKGEKVRTTKKTWAHQWDTENRKARHAGLSTKQYGKRLVQCWLFIKWSIGINSIKEGELGQVVLGGLFFYVPSSDWVANFMFGGGDFFPFKNLRLEKLTSWHFLGKSVRVPFGPARRKIQCNS